MPSSGVKTSALDRKSTRLKSSHGSISYAVFCVKKKRRQKGSQRTILDAESTLQDTRSATTSSLPRPPSPPLSSTRSSRSPLPSFFFFNETAAAEIYTLSLPDALPF